jgi:hypothetical protein
VRRRFRKTVKHIFKNLDIFVYLVLDVGLVSVTRKRFYPIVYSYLQLPITNGQPQYSIYLVVRVFCYVINVVGISSSEF